MKRRLLGTAAVFALAVVTIAAIVWGMSVANDPASPACDVDCASSTSSP
jgi:hypothetical protein